MNRVKVDFSKVKRKVKPMHGINNIPYSVLNCNFAKKFLKDSGAPFCRLHDTMGAYGGSHFVDVLNIFPDFTADETDEDNYDFTLTDEYISCIQESGCQTFYRLGSTIEWASKKYHIHPPADYQKWARICERIIMHYNYGWADGFEFGIKYWEIWNEPENPPMWTGTREEFFELYCTASKYLKEKFPEISLGGYGSCGFYAVTRENMNDFYKSFVPYFTDFLAVIKENNAPLDFFSWHIYTSSVDEVSIHAKYVRDTLDRYGFTDTETFLNEWNYGDEGTSHVDKRTINGAVFVASVMCKLQNEGTVDGAMYYCVNANTVYNGLTNPADGSYFKPMYAMMMFRDLYTRKNTVECMHDLENVYVTAASDNDGSVILICNDSEEAKVIEVEFANEHQGTQFIMEELLLSDSTDAVITKTEIFRGNVMIPVVNLPAKAVVELKISHQEWTET